MYIVLKTNNINSGILYKSPVYTHLSEARETFLELYNELVINLEEENENDVESILCLTDGVATISYKGDINNDDMVPVYENITYKVEIIEIKTEQQEKAEENEAIRKKEEEEKKIELNKDLTCKNCGEFLREITAVEKGIRDLYYFLNDHNNEYEFYDDEYECEEVLHYKCDNCNTIIDNEQMDIMIDKYRL